MAARILIVEDEPGLLEGLTHNFQFEGYEVETAANGKDGLKSALNDKPDLVVLDLMLPEKSGFDVLKEFRERNAATPVLILTARNFEADIVKGFDLGADDYVTKPFSVAELMARVRVAMRHISTAKQDSGESVFEIGTLRVDLARREVFVREQRVHLTPNEFRLLSVLVKNAGKVMTHRQLLKEIWGPGSAEQSHYVRVYMNQLRQKIEADPARPEFLLTETGIGYRLRMT